jgi:hypothetical protein
MIIYYRPIEDIYPVLDVLGIHPLEFIKKIRWTSVI